AGRPNSCSPFTRAWARARSRSWAIVTRRVPSWSSAHDRGPVRQHSPRLCPAAGVAWHARPAGLVVAATAHSAAPAPYRFPADTAAVRDCAEGRDTGAHPVVADAAAVDACSSRHHCRGRPVVEPTARDLEPRG